MHTLPTVRVKKLNSKAILPQYGSLCAAGRGAIPSIPTNEQIAALRFQSPLF